MTLVTWLSKRTSANRLRTGPARYFNRMSPVHAQAPESHLNVIKKNPSLADINDKGSHVHFFVNGGFYAL